LRRPGGIGLRNQGWAITSKSIRFADFAALADVDANVLYVDEGSVLEIHPRWAKELIVGFARLDGSAIGIVANQPKHKGGVLFSDSADKAARFIWTCNAFNVPLLFLADVPGFMIGTQVEREGIIRHGAKMISAVSEATVPKISVIVRKAYGAGLYAMAGPAFDPDCCLALPSASIAVMGPQAAINAVYYNQLQAIYFNEQIIFFETAIGRKVLEALLRLSLPPELAKGLRQFLEEEQQHTEMFRRLNQQCAPQFYGAGHFYFIQPPRAWMAALSWATERPRLFPMFLWLMLLQEERSLFYSRRVIAQREELEPHFVKTHRTHLADEVGHVRWDEELIESLWQRANPFLRKVNAQLFGWMLGEFFNAPKRA